jgi:hypothetical protein
MDSCIYHFEIRIVKCGPINYMLSSCQILNLIQPCLLLSTFDFKSIVILGYNNVLMYLNLYTYTYDLSNYTKQL